MRRTKASVGGGRRLGRLTAAAALALAVAACQDFQPSGPASVGGGYGYGYAPPGRPPPPPPPPAVVQPGFTPQDFAWSVGEGPSSLIGRVAYRSAAGERWTCAAQTVALIPAVRYSGERMRVLYGSDAHAIVPAAEVRTRNAEQPGVDYGRYVRTAACDAHDAFSFARLPSGPYFLIARARPRGHAAGPNEGVVIMQRIDLSPGPTRLTVPQG